MPEPQGFLIELSNPVRSFFPGQAIIGRVVVSNNKPRDLKNISITFEGKASVHWTESETVTTGHGRAKKKSTHTKHYTAEESYFTCKIMLLGNESGTFALSPGTTFYPFQFTLPGNLPSSYTSKIGMVHYVMEARMKRSWSKSDLTSIVPFTVNGILDLNTEIGATDPQEFLKHKNVCCCCCRSGPVGYKIKLERKGFVPGEFAAFNVEMINMSRRKVNRLQVSLVQLSSFHAEGKSRQISNVICKVNSPSLDRGGSDSWGGNVLRIPPIPPTRLANCRIIDVQYFLSFEMDLNGLTMNLRTKVPIIIGTIPLRNTFVDLMPSAASMMPVSSFQPNPMSGSVPVHGFIPQQVAPIPGPSAPRAFDQPVGPSAPVYEMYPDLPPPTYAEAMQIDMDSVTVINEQIKPKHDTGGGDPGNSHAAFRPGVVSTGGQFDADSASGQPSSGTAPSGHEGREFTDYVPSYITYGFSVSSTTSNHDVK